MVKKNVFLTLFCSAFIFSSAFPSYAKSEYSEKLSLYSPLSCNDTINLVKQELIKRKIFAAYNHEVFGYLKPEIKLDKNIIKQNYYDYPASRTEAVIIPILYEEFNISEKLMTTWASKIMSECHQIGLVTFSTLYSQYDIGYFPGNTARVFKNLVSLSDQEIKNYNRQIKNKNGNTMVFWKWGYGIYP